METMHTRLGLWLAASVILTMGCAAHVADESAGPGDLGRGDLRSDFPGAGESYDGESYDGVVRVEDVDQGKRMRISWRGGSAEIVTASWGGPSEPLEIYLGEKGYAWEGPDVDVPLVEASGRGDVLPAMAELFREGVDLREVGCGQTEQHVVLPNASEIEARRSGRPLTIDLERLEESDERVVVDLFDRVDAAFRSGNLELGRRTAQASPCNPACQVCL